MANSDTGGREAIGVASRAEVINGLHPLDNDDSYHNPCWVQAAIIGARFRLSPVRARLVCHLSGIGGRFA